MRRPIITTICTCGVLATTLVVYAQSGRKSGRFQNAAPGFGANLDQLPGSLPPGFAPVATSPSEVTIQYTEITSRTQKSVGPNGKTREVEVPFYTTRTLKIEVAADLEELDHLPPDGKRAALIAVTAARHDKLLEALRDAESEEDKQAASDALRQNYMEHYAIETWWRQQKLDELEAKLAELKQQVEDRISAEKDYVDAAMTIASLHATGIASPPPKPTATVPGTPGHAPGIAPNGTATYYDPYSTWGTAPPPAASSYPPSNNFSPANTLQGGSTNAEPAVGRAIPAAPSSLLPASSS